jgi:hypothetical protein
MRGEIRNRYPAGLKKPVPLLELVRGEVRTDIDKPERITLK